MTDGASDIVRRLLVNLGLGTLPSASDDWPIEIDQEPNSPDDVVTVYSTTGILGPRDNNSGQYHERFGFQIRIRSASNQTGSRKAAAIAEALDEDVLIDEVIIDSETYTVHSVSRTSNVLAIGKEPGTERHLFTINGLANITQQ